MINDITAKCDELINIKIVPSVVFIGQKQRKELNAEKSLGGGGSPKCPEFRILAEMAHKGYIFSVFESESDDMCVAFGNELIPTEKSVDDIPY